MSWRSCGAGSRGRPSSRSIGFSVLDVAPAALAATFLTSIAGVLTYAVLSLGGKGDIAPDWAVGVGMGLGGLAGPNLGSACSTVCRRGRCGAGSDCSRWRSGFATPCSSSPDRTLRW